MTTFVVPPIEEEGWPTLGPGVCDFIEDMLVYGPGDRAGEPYVIEPEFRAQVYRAYEVQPQGSDSPGRRRFKRVVLDMRKGLAKTEKAAILAAVELHPDGPVRCDGFDAKGLPVGVGVRDPYVPLVTYTETQTEELVFGALRSILMSSEIAADFDIGLERILVLGPDGREAGKAVPVAGSPNARDGARTTFQVFDETHRFTKPSLRAAHTTMMENLYKRMLADAWSLETTTAHTPGEESTAEDTYALAEAIQEGRIPNPRMFFFYRGADLDRPMETPAQVKAALVEASGPAVSWSGDIDGLVDRWFEPKTDRNYFRRVWLNQIQRGSAQAVDMNRWNALVENDWTVPEGDLITLGFDGARFRDSTALIGTHVLSGYQWPLGIWEQQQVPDGEVWEVPADEVDEVVRDAFERWKVWRLYADPPYWDSQIDAWAGEWGAKRVVSWWTNRRKPMAYAVQRWTNAIAAGELSHPGDDIFTSHVGHAHRRQVPHLDDEGQELWTIVKERRDSSNKIDAAVAAILSWEARGDAIADGATKQKVRRAGGL